MVVGPTILAPLGLVLGETERAFFSRVTPYGFILFARNLDNRDQIKMLCADLRESVGRDTPIFIDQEGGRVQRLLPPLATQFLAPLDEVERVTAQHGPKAALRAIYLRHRLIAADLVALGIDANCAPTADIAWPQTHEFLRNRCYGTTTKQVSTLCVAAADGLLAGGVLPVIKHIPGHGRSTLDTHFDLPRVTTTKAELMQTDFAVFKALANLPYAMTAHLIYSAIDPEKPATCSPAMMQIIRAELGYDGVVMSDDLSMKSLSGTLTQRTTSALEAGCDLVLHCNGALDEMDEICDAAGNLQGSALVRSTKALTWRTHFKRGNIEAERREHSALLGG